MAGSQEVAKDCCYETRVAAVGTEVMHSGRTIQAAAGMKIEETPEEVSSDLADRSEDLVGTTTADTGSGLRTAAGNNQAVAKTDRTEGTAAAAERNIVAGSPNGTAWEVVGSLQAESAVVGDGVRSENLGLHVLAEPEWLPWGAADTASGSPGTCAFAAVGHSPDIPHTGPAGSLAGKTSSNAICATRALSRAVHSRSFHLCIPPQNWMRKE